MVQNVSISRFALLLMAASLLLVGITVTAQEAITPGTAIEGTYTGEPQVYSLDATRGQLLIISMVSEDFNSIARVAQGDVELASDDNSGGNRNALLAYVVQADGSYDIVADDNYFNSDQGTYTLTVDVVEPAMVTIDGSVTLTPDAEGSARLYTVFEASAGQVINVRAGSVEDENIKVTLRGLDAAIIETDDNDGTDYAGLIRRVVLTEDGLYLVEIANSSSSNPVTLAAEVSIEGTEQLYLDATPQELILGDAEGQIGTEVYTVDVTSGVTYRFIITIESIPTEDVGISLEIFDSEFFFDPELDTRHSTRVVWDFLSNTTGTIRLDVHPNFFGRSEPVIHYTIALEVLE